MNILLLPDVFCPEFVGGITKSLLNETEELIARGHKVIVISRKLTSSSPYYEYLNGHHIFRYPGPQRGSFLSPLFPFYNIFYVPKLIKQLRKKYVFNIAYVHNIFQAVGLNKISTKIPFVFVVHAPIPLELDIEIIYKKYKWKTPLARVVKLWTKTVERKVLERAKAIIVRSRFISEQVHDLYNFSLSKKIHQIPLGISFKKFKISNDFLALKEKLGLPKEKYVLLTVRRLVARMGLENLILAIDIVRKEVPNVLLLIVGQGYLKEKLEKLIRMNHLDKNIWMLGFVPEEKLPLYYQASDLFVLPTLLLEGFGLSTLESLACGTPVIATPVGANPEIIM